MSHNRCSGPASLPRGRTSSFVCVPFEGTAISVPLPYVGRPLGHITQASTRRDKLVYDWSGVRTRRIKVLKVGISLMIAAAALAGPAMVLLRSHH
ncbi:hypothetical protein NXC24_PC01971 (plasmid) [Rhizobium sp. NXC24]|nr:hypothetical protein NXC24_PC01971 [Rhizobium sp. NXC24]